MVYEVYYLKVYKVLQTDDRWAAVGLSTLAAAFFAVLIWRRSQTHTVSSVYISFE